MVKSTLNNQSEFSALVERIRFAAQAMRSLSADQADYSEKMADLRTELRLIASCLREMERGSNPARRA